MSPQAHDTFHDGLHDGLRGALDELAEDAPTRVNAARVLTAARRRRRLRLIAVPSATALTAAAAVLVGTATAGGGADHPGPAERPDAPLATRTDAPLATRPGEILNPRGVLPGPLPAGKVEPVVYGFLDHCGWLRPKGAASASGACAQWRLVGRSGKQWRLPDGVGSRAVKPRDYMSADTPLAISPDGWRIAYQRAKDQRLVVRDLSSGKVTPVGPPTAPTDVPQMMFSGDGTHLALSSQANPGARASLVDTRTGAATALQAGTVIGVSRDASTIVQGDIWDREKPLTVSGQDGAVRARVRVAPKVDLRGINGNALSPDGRTLLTFNSGMDTAVLVNLGTGEIASERRLSGVGGAQAWVGPTTYFTVRDKSRDPSGTEGMPPHASQGVIVDLTTGEARETGRSFSIRTSRSMTVFGGFLP
ncbi:hypothetical protein DZF91_18360 [Actinomadura logoneensis]|uniref:WD40 repeat domain-containing protein n=1 Tax=Actinomadura logoneensis TaxID=2293572 RepID=A0A372JLN9_9ACTN|nr:hypothetical protein [Actinomadura logoneensis]RFU40238.1 hypothetical protein DZF91_18360 [Actinomadura logoneensis]